MPLDVAIAIAIDFFNFTLQRVAAVLIFDSVAYIGSRQPLKSSVQFSPLSGPKWILTLHIEKCLYFCLWLNNLLTDYRYLIKNSGRIQRYVALYGIQGGVIYYLKQKAGKFLHRLQKLPIIRTRIDSEVAVVLQKVETSLINRDGSLTYYTKLPEKGWSESRVQRELNVNANLARTRWEEGRVSGAVYHGGEDILRVQAKAYAQFSVANQLHPDIFPGIRKMESEVVEMVLNIFNGPKGSCGTSTSGGTESLLLTCLAAREKAFRERGITEPEIIAPPTIHAGFDKAAYYFKMKLVHAPLDPETFKVDLKVVEKLINKNTVLLAGSAPNFPHGIIDDIQGLGELATKNNIPLHVDACLGSFIVPFMEEAGFSIPLFDFRVPGVTSISCDTHKYGFAPKGSSIIMYRDNKMRNYQYFVTADWTGGLYASPTLAGSRPGALMAGCWASLVSIGHEGYVASCKSIVSATRRLKKAIVEDIDGIYLIGDPLCSVISFGSDTLNVYELADMLTAKGWHLSALQKPAAIHLAATRLSIPAIDDLITDLKVSVSELSQKENVPVTSDMAALYGVAGSIKTVGVADRIAAGFLDCLYKV